jgi:nicotinate-nucleotide adenylyltransferase
MTPRPFGILGGTFDPIHRGHVGVALAAAGALGLERVLIVPARLPPHRHRPIASIYHRFAMVALAAMTADLLVASDMELETDGPAYTHTLLRRLLDAGHPPSQIVFITGADAFAEIATWRHYPAVLDCAHFAVVSRPGCPASSLPARLPALEPRFTPVTWAPGEAAGTVTQSAQPRVFLIDAATPDVSSTAIRDRAGRGAPLGDLLDEPVAAYVTRHGLYQAR